MRPSHIDTESAAANEPERELHRHGGERLSSLSAIAALTTVLLWVNICLAQPPTAHTGFEMYESDSSGKEKQFVYDLDLEPLGESGFLFHDLANQNILVYNFSAGCHHCRITAPYIKKLSDTLNTYGFILVGIAVSRNKKPNILRFIEEENLDIIMFQDGKRDFAKLYGMDALPIVILVGKNGNYMRGVGNNMANVCDQIKKAVFEKHMFP